MTGVASTTDIPDDPQSSSGASAAPAVRRPTLEEKQAGRATIDLGRFALILAQLIALLAVFRLFKVEGPEFFKLSVCIVAGFGIHYFTPFAFKKYAFIAIGLIGGVLVLQSSPDRTNPIVAYMGPVICVGAVVGLGILFYVILRLPIPFLSKTIILLAIGAALAWGRYENFFLPGLYWGIIGAVFMFRLILYAYESRVAKTPEKFTDFASYFFLMPNFYFPVFPVIDYTTFKRGYYAHDIHESAQRGIGWMIRGAIQLCLLNVVRHQLQIGAYEVASPWTLFQYVVSAYMMYLRISGQFHIIVGMLHLFGYTLPETHRRYLLAYSFTDFWRRINIYWKDFMVKVVYYPVYFRLRKISENTALIGATIVVFMATTVLHGYQWFWIRGDFKIYQSDYWFWGILAFFVMINVLWETKRGRPKERPKAVAITLRVLATIAMWLTITILWSMWTSPPTPANWLDTVLYWR